jgi:hypothetical protein
MKMVTNLTSQLNTEKPSNVAIAADQLILDIKGFVLLSQSKQNLRKTVEEKFLASHDEDVNKFLNVIRSSRGASELGYFLMALGELILAAFLLIGGLASVAPALLGLSSASAIADYFQGIISAISSSGLSNPEVAFLDFAFAVGLLLAGFYCLKVASGNLKEAGVASVSQV